MIYFDLTNYVNNIQAGRPVIIAVWHGHLLSIFHDLRNEKISYKVREHSVSKVPIIIAVGKKEVSERTVSVRRLGSDDTSILSIDDFTTSVVQESLAPNK